MAQPQKTFTTSSSSVMAKAFESRNRALQKMATPSKRSKFLDLLPSTIALTLKVIKMLNSLHDTDIVDENIQNTISTLSALFTRLTGIQTCLSLATSTSILLPFSDKHVQLLDYCQEKLKRMHSFILGNSPEGDVVGKLRFGHTFSIMLFRECGLGLAEDSRRLLDILNKILKYSMFFKGSDNLF
jgi:hypothetical protein